MAKHFHSVLQVNDADTSLQVTGPKQLARVREATAWSSGTQESLKFQTIWNRGAYAVKLGKPGKEAASDYVKCKYSDGHRGNNPNDMKPVIFMNDKPFESNLASFTQIFDEIQRLNDKDKSAVELVGCLLFRSAYMLDHVEEKPGIWRYEPSAEVLVELQSRLPVTDGVPIEVFLHYLDAIAWNEDVKYHTLGYDITHGTGRKNNLLTCTNLIGVLLTRVKISKFAGNFGRPPTGISTISKAEAYRIFPALCPDGFVDGKKPKRPTK